MFLFGCFLEVLFPSSCFCCREPWQCVQLLPPRNKEDRNTARETVQCRILTLTDMQTKKFIHSLWPSLDLSALGQSHKRPAAGSP